jgi:D-glycero-alpha-D-manno-heptose 1-phosphate guanylyltransferase
MLKADRYGVVTIDSEFQITGFEEKREGASGYINGGVYCIYRNSFLNIPFEKKFSFEKDYLEKLMNEREMAGFIQDTYFIDIGIPEDYAKASKELQSLTFSN